MPTVTLTKKEAEWVEWALDVMPAYWHEEMEQPDEPMPILQELVLDLARVNDEVIEDLIERLEWQGTDLCDNDEGHPGSKRVVLAAARKIRAAMKAEGRWR